jgi:hypothetical protein
VVKETLVQMVQPTLPLRAELLVQEAQGARVDLAAREAPEETAEELFLSWLKQFLVLEK